MSTPPTDLAQWLGAQLRQIREAKGLHQHDVARAGVIPQSQLSLLEAGRWPQNHRRLAKLLDFYGVELQIGPRGST